MARHPIFAVPKRRELSSAGSEHLPYKQRVTGSNPVAPTKSLTVMLGFFTLALFAKYFTKVFALYGKVI